MALELGSRTNAPETIAVFVLSNIRNNILNGHYPLGTRLDQQAIAKKLGVSIIPVRESLRQLEAEKLVAIYPRKGAFVVELSVNDLEEIYLLRETLEELAVSQAVPKITPELLKQLATILSQMEIATLKQDIDQVLDFSRRFYFTIYSAAQRPLLSEMLASLWDRSTFYRRMYLYLPDRMNQALAGHKEIFKICKKGDALEASKLIRGNVHRTLDGILEKIQADKTLAVSNTEIHEALR